MKTFFKITLFLFVAIAAWAGEEFRVNTEIIGVQRDPQLARINSTEYVVAWNNSHDFDSGDIMLQYLSISNDNKNGDPIVVNQITDGEQEKARIAGDGEGRLIVTWVTHNGMESIFDVKARLYDGANWGDEFLVNQVTAESQTNPAVAMHSDGSFTIAWESWYQDGSDRGVYARMFNSDGTAATDEFRVNNRTAYSQAHPALRYFDDGSFVVVWESFKQDVATPSGYGQLGRVFSASGEALTAETGINSYTNDYQWLGDVETFSDGNWVAVWCSWQQDGDKGGIYLQQFDNAGSKLGNELQVNETTHHYQWLPRIQKSNDSTFAVAWGSFEQDGSREGVVAQVFRRGETEIRKHAFETPLNLYTDNFQWEPDLLPTDNDGEWLFAWSSWGQFDADYEVIGRRLTPIAPVGYFADSKQQQTAGNSSFRFTVHVVNPDDVKDANYEISFPQAGESEATAQIRNLTDDAVVVESLPLNGGENMFYISEVFEGIAVEMKPVFDFDLDYANSYFENNSGSNLAFEIGEPTLGTYLLAPIDVAIIWGNTDTLSDGTFAQPSDTAQGYFGDVPVPFYAWNLTDGERLELFVAEDNKLQNTRWEPTEDVVMLTPEQYRESSNNTHAQIIALAPDGDVLYPQPGDTNFVYTRRPVTSEDVFAFNTSGDFVSDIAQEKLNAPLSMELLPNYPNPFNPTTTIRYRLEKAGQVRLDIFNVLGQKVATLVDGKKQPGSYRVLWDARNLASGSYFYVLRANGETRARKMLLLK